MPDLTDAWRNQPEERTQVNFQAVMERRTFELSKVTRAETLATIGAAIFFVAVMGWRFAADQRGLPPLGLVAAIAWVAISLYWFRRRIWRRAAAKDALAVTGLEHYRRELEQRRDHLRNAWLWNGPLFLACLTLAATLEGRPVMRGVGGVAPLVAVLVLWAGFGIMRRRGQANELQREIDAITPSSSS